MDIFGVLKSEYENAMTKAAFDMNIAVQDQTSKDAVAKMDRAIRSYTMAKMSLEVLNDVGKAYETSSLTQEAVVRASTGQMGDVNEDEG
jgi:hypothetical protein